MTPVISSIAMSLDGYVAGPDPSLEDPLGVGGEQLHEWAYGLDVFQRMHGREGGETTPSSALMQEQLDRTGAYVMGRRMFSGGSGGWETDPRASGWWGEEPPFHAPVFVLTHHERDPLTLGETTFHFVTSGVEDALARAAAAAGDRAVNVSGGGETIRAFLDAGLLDELTISLVPLVLGGGTPLFTGPGPRLEVTQVIEAPGVTHLRHAVRR
jgi:dihydrofolate reductase